MAREPYEIYLREDQWEEMAKVLQQEVNRSKAIQKKCVNHPSFTISSAETMDRHELRIKELTEIIDAIRENY